MASLASQTYSEAEKAEVQRWLATAERLGAADAAAAAAPDDRLATLDALNAHLASRTTVLGCKPSEADVALYRALAPAVAAWSPDERSGQHGHPHIVRHLDFVQHAPQFGLDIAPDRLLRIDPDDVRYVKPPVDAKTEKERLKKEKAAAAPAPAPALVDRTAKEAKGDAAAAAAAAGAGNKPKQDKKEKAPKQQKPAAAVAPPSPALIDLRVGHILKAVPHPDADSLYVSTIAVGDAPGDDTVEYEGQVCRTVCSGLNGLVPLADMQGRKVVVVCNLKPVKMRGIKSSAMVLAASPRLADDHKGPVELVAPPAAAAAGDRLFFQGWQGEPEGQLNPKKKIWETFQPGFTTTDALEVAFDPVAVGQPATTGVAKLVTAAGGVCTVQSLKGAVVR